MEQAIQFESVIEGGMIRIPEQYLKTVPAAVKVTLAPAFGSKIHFAPRAGKGDVSLDDFTAIKISTKGFKFDREEANERR